MSPSKLTQIVRQAASGDAEARLAFELQIVPLVETVVRRWLKQQARDQTRPAIANRARAETTPPNISSDEARQVTTAVCARLMRQFVSPMHAATRPDETLVARQLLDTLVGPALPTTG